MVAAAENDKYNAVDSDCGSVDCFVEHHFHCLNCCCWSFRARTIEEWVVGEEAVAVEVDRGHLVVWARPCHLFDFIE